MWKNECTKFSPNIFNKNKCSNCYQTREQHSARALEVNKATRNVSRCGYLSVAPNWDFSNPVYRTKRWQRRWFVLYDDGELTYSVDDHPETVPQATINLNSVFEVAEADPITGNEHSIAIVASDAIHFIKGSCKEESRIWLDILRLFPQPSTQNRSSVNGGRAKRSQTFPGMRNLAASAFVGSIAATLSTTAAVAASGATTTTTNNNNNKIQPNYNQTDEVDHSEPPTAPTEPPGNNSGRYKTLTYIQDKKISESTWPSSSPSTSSPASTPPPVAAVVKQTQPVTRKKSSASLILAKSSAVEKVLPERGYQRAYDKTDFEAAAKSRYCLNDDEAATSENGSLFSRRKNSCSSAGSSASPADPEPPWSETRGTPDGCGNAQDLSSSPTASTTTATSDFLNKKGWLMKKSPSNEWHKYWFVLQDVALLYYRDPGAEIKGFLDGIVDLSLVRKIQKLDLSRHFGFSIETFENKMIMFSAITDGIRNSWIISLKKAAGIKEEIVKSVVTTSSASSPSSLSSTSSSSASRYLQRFSSSGQCFDELPVITTARLVRSSVISSSTSGSNAVCLLSSSSTATTITQQQTSGRKSSSSLSSCSDQDDDDDDDDNDDNDDDDDDETAVTSSKRPDSRASPETSVTSSSPSSSSSSSCAIPAAAAPPALSGDDILVDLLETEVDSLKAQLEKTQSELLSLHQSNRDLSTQLRQKKNSGRSFLTTGRRHSTSSRSSASDEILDDADVEDDDDEHDDEDDEEEEDPDDGGGGGEKEEADESESMLRRPSADSLSTLANQAAEILSLRNQVSMNELHLQQRWKSLQDERKKSSGLQRRLEESEVTVSELESSLRSIKRQMDKEQQKAEQTHQELEQRMDQVAKEADRWKQMYESTCAQYNRDLRTWQDDLADLQKTNQVREQTLQEEKHRKERIIADLSEQLKESEDRIQELLIELETARERNDHLTSTNQEKMCRLVVSMEEKFEQSLQHEKQQLEMAFREKLKDQALFDGMPPLMMMMAGGLQSCPSGRRTSQAKITTMSDLLSFKVPSMESIESMEHEEMTDKFLLMMDHFYRSIDEIRTLRMHLREAQDTNDQLELEKLRFEESFKRTIVMQEQQENLMSKRIQDLTNKLLVSEKTVRQLKEQRKHSKKNSTTSISSSNSYTS